MANLILVQQMGCNVEAVPITSEDTVADVVKRLGYKGERVKPGRYRYQNWHVMFHGKWISPRRKAENLDGRLVVMRTLHVEYKKCEHCAAPK